MKKDINDDVRYYIGFWMFLIGALAYLILAFLD